MMPTLGSLFDGSGTAPLAAAMNGIMPVWASEVEPYPILVTKTRFPNMQHLGSITEIKGNEVVPVDIICGGSPCQDLSVAGKQAGLEGGTRSHLFFEMTRIIKEMREATNGKYPRYIIWENVPGAFSSNNGYDFLSVLQSFAEIAEADVHVPEPERKADRLVWQYAGEMVGNGWSIAWRTVDAQYWGVPQRRRRIYLVADLDSERAGEVLFEHNCMSGNPEQGGETRKGSAGAAEKSTGGVRYCLQGNGIDRADTAGCNGAGWRENESYTLNTIDRPAVVFSNTGFGKYTEGTNTLKASGGDYGGGPEMLCVYDARGNGDAKIAPTVTGDHNNRVTDYTAICVGNGQMDQARISPLVGELNCMHDQQIILENNGKSATNYIVRRLTPLECCRLQGFPDWWESGLAIENPNEEDVAFWRDAFETHRKINNPNGNPKTDNQIIKWLKNPYSDSASYKMWGNGMALPNMMHVMKGISKQLCKKEDG